MEKKIPRIDPKKEVITRDKLYPFFEDIKELIKSTAKGTENVLKREIDIVKVRLEATQMVVTENSRDIKGLKSDIQEVRSEMKDMEVRLSDKIDNIGLRVEDHDIRISKLETAHP